MLFPAALAAYADLDLASLARKSGPSVVLLVTTDSAGNEISKGTGFLVSSDGQLVTSRHVIGNADAIVARMENGGLFVVEGTLADDSTNDLVLLKLSGRELPFLQLSRESGHTVGTRVAVIGSPLGLQGTLSEGIISALRKLSGGRTMLQITAPISPGSSGSPVLNSQGEVVGVAASQVLGGQSLNLAVPSTYVSKLLATVTDGSKPRALKASTSRRSPSMAFLDPSILKGLEAVSVKVVGSGIGTSVASQIERELQTKLPAAGLRVEDHAIPHFRISVGSKDIDPTGVVRGKVGSVIGMLLDAVESKRVPNFETMALVWSTTEIIFHGPPETVPTQVREYCDQLIDEFTSEFIKQNKTH